MGDVKIDGLMKRSNELFDLINSADNSLHIPASTARVSFEQSLSKIVSKVGPKIVAQMQKSIQRGRIEEVILVVAVLGGPYVCASIYDAVRNAWARKEAKEAMLGYYQELATKQNMIIREHSKISAEYAKCAAINSAEADRLKKRCDELEALAAKILQFQQEVSN